MSAITQALKLASRAGAPWAAKVMFGLARMHWRYFVFGRGRGLAKLLPLAAPLKVHVDPASGCNFKCFFCPQADPDALRQAGVEFRSMTLPLFKKLVDDLGAFPQRVDELVLGNYGEPLLNKNLPEMIRYAKASGHVREVSVITNASLLDGERADLLAAAGPDKIRISIEALSDAELPRNDRDSPTVYGNRREYQKVQGRGAAQSWQYIHLCEDHRYRTVGIGTASVLSDIRAACGRSGDRKSHGDHA